MPEQPGGWRSGATLHYRTTARIHLAVVVPDTWSGYWQNIDGQTWLRSLPRFRRRTAAAKYCLTPSATRGRTTPDPRALSEGNGGVAAGVQGRQKGGRPCPRISAPGLNAAISHLDHQFVHFPHSETGRRARDQLAHQRVPVFGSPPPPPVYGLRMRHEPRSFAPGCCAPGRLVRSTTGGEGG